MEIITVPNVEKCGKSSPLATSNMAICKLCKGTRALQKSHIVPRFVRKQTRTASAVKDPRYYTGEGDKFCKVEQDLPKRAWLCQECEQLFSLSEKTFAESVYQPLWTGRTVSDKAKEEHIHRFLVSMAWRTWHWYDEHAANPLRRVSNLDRLKKAEESWRTYLLGKRDNVGEFELHMLVLGDDIPDPARLQVMPRSYYWSRGVNLDMIGIGESTEEILMVHTKIPKVAMFGMVERNKCGKWRGTLVEPGISQTWASQKATIPEEIGHYMYKQREKMLAVMRDAPQSVRAKTQNKMNTLIQSELDDYLKRDAVQSMIADELMELPEESIVSDVLRFAAESADPRGQKLAELLGLLSKDEMKSLHRETNRMGIRCKTLLVEESFCLLACESKKAKKEGKAIAVCVEAYRTRDRAMDKSELPLVFGLNSEDVAIAIGAEAIEHQTRKR